MAGRGKKAACDLSLKFQLFNARIGWANSPKRQGLAITVNGKHV